MRTAIITGGTSGIGLAIAQRLLAEGFSVHVWGRNTERGHAAETALNAAAGRSGATFVACDVRAPDAIRLAVARFTAQYDALDLLVNAAGLRRTTPLSAFEPEAIAEQVDTILTGTLCVTAALRPVFSRAGALIVNIGSVAGRESFPSLGAYGAAKAGVIHFTRTVAKELFPAGIRCVCICPGAVDTPMYSGIESTFLKRILPRHRLQSVDEIAELMMLLLSPKLGSINGSIIDVDDSVLLFPGGIPKSQP